MIDKNVRIKCPWCYKDSMLYEWNDLSFTFCVNREMKRLFTKLNDKKAFRKKNPSYYICPKCKNWSKGSQLKIVGTDDKELSKLGGEPLVKINKKPDLFGQ